VQFRPDFESPPRRRINASVVSAIVADHILAILGLAFLIAAGTVAWVMHSPRKFTASVTVAPVGNARQLNIPSSIAGSLLGSMNSGIQATPVFVARLARLRNVLDAVARRTVPGRQQTIIEGVMRRPLAEIDAYKFPVELDKQLQTTIDRESGTVTFAAALADSALARAIVNALVDGVSATYTRAMKSQAGALVEAQAARVDSAAKRVRQAGSAVVNFGSANRVVATTSPLWVEQQRLQENLNIAQSVYTQANILLGGLRHMVNRTNHSHVMLPLAGKVQRRESARARRDCRSHHHIGNLFRRAEAAKGQFGFDKSSDAFWIVFLAFLPRPTRKEDRAWSDTVDTNSLRCQFTRHFFGKTNYRCLGCVVGHRTYS
jgi:hypothetical protein